jgi:galactose oxidase
MTETDGSSGISRRQLLVRGGSAVAALGLGSAATGLVIGSEDSSPPGEGSWGDLISTDGTAPVHASLLPSGKVLMNGTSGGAVRDFMIDPSVGRPIHVDDLGPPMRMEQDTLFCAGHAPLTDGRMLLVGGQRSTPEQGLDYGLIFDQQLGEPGRWTAIDDDIVGGPSWYPTVTRLANGDMLIISGFTDWGGEENRTIQLFQPRRLELDRSPWNLLVPRQNVPNVSPTGADYTHVFVLPRPVTLDGHERQVVMVGRSGEIWFFNHSDRFGDPAERFVTRPNARRPAPANASPGWGTSSVMVADGRILIVGHGDEGGEGTPSLMSRADIYDPYRDDWRSIDTGVARIYPVAILLPDGTVAIVNGDGGRRGDPRTPQIIDPDSGAVIDGPRWPDGSMRGYHNSALLVPDGRVLTASGEGRGLSGRPGGAGERPDLRYFSPPYLATPESARPEVIGVSGKMRYGRPFPIRFRNGPIHRVTLLAPGAMTHSIDMNQRAVVLFDGETGGEELTVTGPGDRSIAPPGYYMLFLLAEVDGVLVPSKARMIRVA